MTLTSDTVHRPALKTGSTQSRGQQAQMWAMTARAKWPSIPHINNIAGASFGNVSRNRPPGYQQRFIGSAQGSIACRGTAYGRRFPVADRHIPAALGQQPGSIRSVAHLEFYSAPCWYCRRRPLRCHLCAVLLTGNVMRGRVSADDPAAAIGAPPLPTRTAVRSEGPSSGMRDTGPYAGR